MQSDRSADIAIIGAGIVGLAHAYMALRKGYKVVLFERDQFATGASIRNFGLIWPIGQERDVGLECALRSRRHWIEVAEKAGLWLNKNGSLHLAYHDDEWDILNEFIEMHSGSGYDCDLLDSSCVVKMSNMVNSSGLKGGLWSKTECTVNPRQALRNIPLWLQEKYGLILRFGHLVTEINIPLIRTHRELWKISKAIVCSGTDFQSLYPEVFDRYAMIKCKLQMMKARTTPSVFMGPTLCGGLTLRHYAAFSKCRSLFRLNDRYDQQFPFYRTHGIHVMLAQNGAGELIIGDSHHYGTTLEPFDSEIVNENILRYLKTFANTGNLIVTERWNGFYAKVPGKISLIAEPEPNVLIVNGLGGAGMTLSFGLAEEVIERL